jgi:hypothetical protein
MAGLFAWQQVRMRRATAPTGATLLPASAETWLGIYLTGDRPVGVLHLSTRAERRQGAFGTTLHLDGRMQVRLLGTPAELSLDGWLWRAVGEPRAEFDATINSAGGRLRAAGRIYNDELHARITTGGETFPVTLPVDRSLLAPDLLLWRFPAPKLRPGEETTLDAFDPISGRPAKLRLACLREEDLRVGGGQVRARVFAASTTHGTITAWLTDDGEVIKADTPWGLSVRRLSAAEALALRHGGDGPELVSALRILPSGVHPVHGARRMVVRLSGMPESRPLPTDDNQRLGTDVKSLVIAPVQPLPDATSGATGAELAAALTCDALVQCDHPKIRAQAAEIVAGERDPWRRAVRIERWVFTSLVKRPVLSINSALEVLARREGDCTEHTALFTALARADGIPARQIAGLVWSEALQGFAYHAWPEVFVGRWVWMDPTFGQEVADATHIRMHAPGEDWQDVLDSLGRLRVEVVEAE